MTPWLHNLMHRLLCFAALLLNLSSGHAWGAILVGPGGTGVQAFQSTPGVSNWSTTHIPGTGNEITTASQLDAAVQLLTAASVSNALAASATYPPSQNARARWNSREEVLQTRVTGIRYAVLMATLQNSVGASVSNLVVRYNYIIGAVTFEEILGLRAYYSLTGESNSWQNIPEFFTSTNGPLTATLNLGAWATNELLYILWADDRVTSADDAYYMIDNFAAWPALATNLFVPVFVHGTGTNDFSTAAQTNGWTTQPISVIGGYASNITNSAQMDLAVQKLSAATSSFALGTTFTTPPDGGSRADWHRGVLCLDSCPVGVDFTTVKVTLRNDTGASQTSLGVSYDCGDFGIAAMEHLPAYRVYWSHTGLPNSWEFIPSLSHATGQLSTALNLGHWPLGAPLFILWVDDNGPLGSTHGQSIAEGMYTLDNFSSAPAPPFLSLTRLSNQTNEITWPSFVTNFVLKATTNLLEVPWQPVPEPDAPRAGLHRVGISNAPGARYFRLEKP